jgi:hypothetical protein
LLVLVLLKSICSRSGTNLAHSGTDQDQSGTDHAQSGTDPKVELVVCFLSLYVDLCRIDRFRTTEWSSLIAHYTLCWVFHLAHPHYGMVKPLIFPLCWLCRV